MSKEIDFVMKTKRILVNVPPYASRGEKVAAICRRFRLNGKEAWKLLKRIES